MLQLLTDCSPCGYVVDFVRSCYQSRWRLPGNNGRVVDGQYIFAPPNAPGYPLPHYWGSRNYTTNNFIVDDTYGEDRHRRQKWTNGEGKEDTPPTTLILGDGTCTRPALRGRTCCFDPEVVPRFLVVRFAYLDVSWQQSYEYVDGLHNGDAEWRLLGPLPGVLKDCAPLSPLQGKVSLGMAPSIVFFCPEETPTGNPWIVWPMTIAINDTEFGVPGFTQDQPVGQKVFPIGLTFQSEDPVALHCAAGDVSDRFRVALFGSDDLLPAGPIPPVDESNFYLGFPVQCWPASPGPTARPWPFSPFDSDWRRSAAEVLCFQYRFPPIAESKLRGMLGDGYTLTRVDNTASVIPGTLIATSTGRVVIFVSGTTNESQLAIQGAQSFAEPSPRGLYKTLPLWDLACDQVLGRLTSAGMGTSEEIAIVGHSYGGAIAQILAFRLNRANPQRKISLITYAAPPVGKIPTVGNWPSRIVSSFICNDGDPMTLVPPPFTDMLWLKNVLPTLPLAAWSQWTRPRQTTRLTEDGEFVTDDVLTFQLLDLQIITANILAGGVVAFPDAHLMPEYVRRLWLPNTPPTVCGDPG